MPTRRRSPTNNGLRRRRQQVFLRTSQKMDPHPPVVSLNIGACENCPSYASTMAHEPDGQGGMRIHCQRSDAMVLAQTEVSDHTKCPVYIESIKPKPFDRDSYDKYIAETEAVA